MTSLQLDSKSSEQFIEAAFITPEMQWEVLSALGDTNLTINVETGRVAEIKPMVEILNRFEKKLEAGITSSQKESLKNALKTMLEAADIAIFVATIEAAYQDQKYIFYQNADGTLMGTLYEKRDKINAMANRVNTQITIDIPQEQPSSYFSWFWGSSSTVATKKNSNMTIPVHGNEVTIPKDLIEAIIENNDYKTKATSEQSANLLFKECFLAQHRDKHHHLFNYQKPHIISATNYIYDNIPGINEMCEIAKNLVIYSPVRLNLNDRLEMAHKQAHELLIDIRQAIQTAIYIANGKSNINVGYILPNAVLSYLDTIDKKLIQYDTMLSELCKKPLYGATPDDTYKDDKRTSITFAAAATAGIAIGATVACTMYGICLPTPPLSSVTSYLPSWAGGGSSDNQAQVAPQITTPQAVTPRVESGYNWNSEFSNVATQPASTSWGDWLSSKVSGDWTVQDVGNAAQKAALAGNVSAALGAAAINAGYQEGQYAMQAGKAVATAGGLGGALSGNAAGIGGAVSTGGSIVGGSAGTIAQTVGSGLQTAGHLQNNNVLGAGMSAANTLNTGITAYKNISQNAQSGVNQNVYAQQPGQQMHQPIASQVQSVASQPTPAQQYAHPQSHDQVDEPMVSQPVQAAPHAQPAPPVQQTPAHNRQPQEERPTPDQIFVGLQDVLQRTPDKIGQVTGFIAQENLLDPQMMIAMLAALEEKSANNPRALQALQKLKLTQE